MSTTCHHALRPPAHTGDRRQLGDLGEAMAAAHLEADGLQIVARNWRLAAGELRGELDLIAVDRGAGLIVVCEVKTRRNAHRFDGALVAVHRRKQAKIRALTGAFLREARLGLPRTRFDVIGIDLGDRPELRHVAGAF
jgi:putative endonuclease